MPSRRQRSEIAVPRSGGFTPEDRYGLIPITRKTGRDRNAPVPLTICAEAPGKRSVWTMGLTSRTHRRDIDHVPRRAWDILSRNALQCRIHDDRTIVCPGRTAAPAPSRSVPPTVPETRSLVSGPQSIEFACVSCRDDNESTCTMADHEQADDRVKARFRCELFAAPEPSLRNAAYFFSRVQIAS